MRFKLLNCKFYFFHTFKCDLQLSPRYKLKVDFSEDNYAPLRKFLIKKNTTGNQAQDGAKREQRL